MPRKAPVNRALIRVGFDQLPAPIEAAGERASWRFIEFFTANIRNPNTRRAYGRAVGDFFGWCAKRNVRRLEQLNPTLVAAYIEQLGATHAKPSVKQHLAAIRMLFDWLILGHVISTNSATAVRGPSHVVKRGKTPVLTSQETR